MIQGFTEFPMYTAPARVAQASEAWLRLIGELLGAQRISGTALDLPELWLSPRLLLAQTCGYPLMTLLRGKVRLVGTPVYQLPHSANGQHCSLLMVRQDDPRTALTEFLGSRGLVNDTDSNSGMNLLRHSVAPLQREGRFFSGVSITGGHRHSLRWLKEGRGDIAAIDSVTYDYLARDGSEEVSGLRILERSAQTPCLPFICTIDLHADQAEAIRQAMNQALLDLPDVAQTLAISSVSVAREEDYHLLLDYERQATELGLASLFC
jgi:ABC-type phosphate/phosphonate transport system substrate-binding protein